MYFIVYNMSATEMKKKLPTLFYKFGVHSNDFDAENFQNFSLFRNFTFCLLSFVFLLILQFF